MATRTDVKIEATQFEFEVTPQDFAHHKIDPYHEITGVVATAFKRQFPDEPFVRVHGDYYIGLGKSFRDYDRYVFENADQELINKFLYGATELNNSFTLHACRIVKKEEVVK